MITRFSSYILILASVMALNTSPAFAAGEVNEIGTVGMSFLRITPSAKIASMGGGSFAAVSGASSAWSNPALITGLTQRTVEFTHNEWIEGIKQESAAFATKTSLGHFAIGLQLFDSGDIELRSDAPSADPDGSYSITNAAFALSYARSVANVVSVGVTAKKLFQKVLSETANGFAFDAGVVVKTPVEGLVASVTARNYGSMSELKNEETELPSDVGVGVAYSGVVPSMERPYLFVVDYVSPKYGDSGVRLGAEIEALDSFFLRAGYRSDYDTQDVSFGVGFHYQKFAFDVAYIPMKEGFDNTFRLTVGLAGF